MNRSKYLLIAVFFPAAILILGLHWMPDKDAQAAAGTVIRVSVLQGGGQASGRSSLPALSADGVVAAFVSSASDLVTDDTNGVADIFVADLTGHISRVSVSSGGVQADGDSYDVALSDSGRYVAFSSSASNLTPGDTNGKRDIFVHDRQTGTTERVSVSSGGDQGDGDAGEGAPSLDISGDGRYVVFQSAASNMIPNDVTVGEFDIYIHDRLTGETGLVSMASDGAQADRYSSEPSVSGDGRYIAFFSYATNLDSRVGSPNPGHIYVRDRQTGWTELVSVGRNGEPANGASNAPRISSDGRYLAFELVGSNLVPNDSNGYNDIFVRDLLFGATERVSIASDGVQADSFSRSPSISGDGRFVVFESKAQNLVPGYTTNAQGVFVHDRLNGATTLLSVGLDGQPGNGESGEAAISDNGILVGFASGAYNLVANDTNFQSDVFVATWTAPYLLGCFETAMYPLPGSLTGIALADMDGDGALDIIQIYSDLNFIGGHTAGFEIRHNDGSGHFTQVQSQATNGETGISMGDVNGDQAPDAILYNGIVDTATLWVNTGGILGFDQEIAPSPDGQTIYAASLADVDADGDLDILTDEYEKVTIRWNDGSGRFTPGPVMDMSARSSIVVADVDHDNKAEILFDDPRNSQSKLDVYKNMGDGTFSLFSSIDNSLSGSQYYGGLVVVDLNNDGNLDAVTTSYWPDESDIFFGDGAGQFSRVRVIGMGPPVVAGDLNEDGWIDLFSDGRVWFNDGAGGFGAVVSAKIGDVVIDAVLGDLNGDRHLDAVVGSILQKYQPGETGAIYFNGRCCALEWLAEWQQPAANFAGVSQAETALPNAVITATLSLPTLYSVRDLLAQTYLGRQYIDQYYGYNQEVLGLMLADPSLAGEAFALMMQWQPNLQALVNGQGSAVLITPEQVQSVQNFLDHLSAAGGPALRRLIAEQRAIHPPDSFVGLTLEEARTQLIGRVIFLPMVRR